MTPGEFRLRVRYAKSGRLRFLSHLEVARAVERSVRRAGLPYAVTQGFVPRMKIAFGPALPVGTAGRRESLDVWLTAYVPAHEALRRLAAATPPDLLPFEALYAAAGEPSLSAACTIGSYEVALTGGEVVTAEELSRALDEVRAASTLTVTHKGKDKVFDLSRALPKEPSVRSSEEGPVVEITTHMGQEGSLRPEALVGAALEKLGFAGAVMSVTRLDVLAEEDTG